MHSKNRQMNKERAFTLIRSLFAVILLLFVLCGCEQALFTDRPEEEINDMMAILISHDIACSKSPGAEGTFSLSVDGSDIAKAVKVLKDQGYPREHFANTGELFQKKGLISSPAEERIRYIFALSQEVSGTIAQIDGVLASRVHIVLPENDPFGERAMPSSASVFIKYKPEYDIESQAIKIKELVVNSIEGLEFKNVTVALFKAEPEQTKVMPVKFVSILGLQMSSDSAKIFRWITALFSSLGVGCLLTLGYLLHHKGFLAKRRRAENALVNLKKR